MKLRYKYRLYPNKHQEQKMKQSCGNTRWLEKTAGEMKAEATKSLA